MSLALVSDADVTAVGYVREISPAVDPKSSTVRVKVAIQNPPAAMTLGSAIAGTAGTKPASADHVAVDRPDGNGVKARGLDRRPQDKDSVAEAGDVGGYEAGAVLIKEGLEPGDRVVIDGGKLLSSGQPVTYERGSVMRTRS